MCVIVRKVVSEEDSKRGEGVVGLPGNSPEVEAWLKVYRSEQHRMSAPPPAQQTMRSAELGRRKTLDESHYHEALKRYSININIHPRVSTFEMTDIVFNYGDSNQPFGHEPQGSSYARTHEVVIGDCRISMQKPAGTLTELQNEETKYYMETHARVGIPQWQLLMPSR